MFKKVLLLFFIYLYFNIIPISAATTIDSVTPVTSGNIEKFAKFEVKFNINGSTYTNPFFPYDTVSYVQVPSGAGISVDAQFLQPGKTIWTDAKKIPCFYFQPYDSNLVPVGSADWRCRFTPDIIGGWKYKLFVTDKNGTITSNEYQFTVVDSNKKGFVKLSSKDYRFFEFSDGSAFPWSLVTVNPIRNGPNIQATMNKLGQNGIKFIRWFPNREDGTVNVFSDNMAPSWAYGPAGNRADTPDPETGKFWSFTPYYYSGQNVYLVSGQKYKFTVRANVTQEKVLIAELGSYASLNICSASNSLHSGCLSKKDGWNTYTTTFTATNTGNVRLYMKGCYTSTDAGSPCNVVREGNIRINDIILQRDESGAGNWGANIIRKGNADTYLYFDQNESALLDDVFKYSEQSGVYHKLTLFHKNDEVMNYLDKSGNIVDMFKCDWGYCPYNFYSETGGFPRWLQLSYVRYFIARWGYSPAIHSLEYVNESDFNDKAFNPALAVGKFIAENSPRKILYTNSYWGWWIGNFFDGDAYRPYVDYGDKHWYSSQSSTETELISTIWQDTVANVRQCYNRFKEYSNMGTCTDKPCYKKPIVRGETSVTASGTGPLHPDVKNEITGTYFHKKVWAHTGVLGYSCDGEWYPHIFDSLGTSSFPNTTYDVYKIYSTYDKFITDEPRNNGTHIDLGTDYTGNNQITSSDINIRAFGSKDPVTSRLLVWVDNKNNTWQNPNNTSNATSTLTVNNMPQGTYTKEVWDTRAGTFIKTDNAVTVTSSGTLSFSVTTAKDTAFKFYIPNIVVTTPTISATPTPNPSINPIFDVNSDGKVNLLDVIAVLNEIFR